MAPPARGCQGAPPGEPGALFWGGTVPVCPASSSPGPVGGGALRACWWWDMWVPLPETGCPPSQRRGAMGDPLSCCAEDLLGGSHPPPCPAPASFPPTCVLPPPNGSQVLFPSVPRLGRGGGVSSCCFPLPLGGLDHSIQTVPTGRLAALGPYLLRLQDRLTPAHPPKKQGVLLALVHRAATIPLPSPGCS